MTYVIAEPCIGVKDAACVDVCPVDCIYESEEHNMLLISPEECIDCAACEPVLPGRGDIRRGRHAPGVGQLHRPELRVLRRDPLGQTAETGLFDPGAGCLRVFFVSRPVFCDNDA